MLNPNQLVQRGTTYGGFYLPKQLELDKRSIIYLAGVGEDVSFDVAIAKQTGAKIYLFDPTPKSITHINNIKTAWTTNTKPVHTSNVGGNDPNYWDIIFNNKVSTENFIMHEYGIFTENKMVKFYKPKNPEYVSHSMVKELQSSEYIQFPVRTLESIMNEYDHNTIDLLKLDIEGVECEVLLQMFASNIFPKYICVDFDAARAGIKMDLFNQCMAIFSKNNYKILHNINGDISFIRNH